MKDNVAQTAAGMSNLLLLAQILEEAHRRDVPYRQTSHVLDDGAAGCALGAWCAFKGVDWLDLDVEEVQNDFAITAEEAGELFSGSGCGNAQNAAQAAAYLRGFASRRSLTRAA
jgi:hypothetical protein